jgi:hypothetical protein
MKRLLFALVLIALLLTPALAAQANGNNQVIFLTYLPGVSNSGNKSASGIAVVDLVTGEVAVQVTNLTLTDNGHYEVWLTGPNLTNPVHVSALPSDGHLPTVIVPNLPPMDYRYVLLTLESDGATPATPGDKRSLAGVFPNAEAVAELAGVGSSGQTVTGEPPSAQLPVTGALLPDSWVQAGTAALAAFVAFIAGTRRSAAKKARRRITREGDSK